MANRDKAVEQATADAAESPDLDSGQQFLEGLIAVYELGVQFERHGRDRNASRRRCWGTPTHP